jgi:hypothetical protein
MVGGGEVQVPVLVEIAACEAEGLEAREVASARSKRPLTSIEEQGDVLARRSKSREVHPAIAIYISGHKAQGIISHRVARGRSESQGGCEVALIGDEVVVAADPFPWHPHRGIETITFVLVG